MVCGMALTLTTTLEPRGPACAIIRTDEQVSELGGGKRAAVRVAIGERSLPLPLRMAVMGGENLIGLSRPARADLGVETRLRRTQEALVMLREGRTRS